MSKDKLLAQAVYSTSRKICKEVSEHLDMEFQADAVDLISELTWKKLQLYGPELEAFEKHAKRSTVTVDDVMLLVRRNDSLKEILDGKLQVILSNNPTTIEPNASSSTTTTSSAPKRKRKQT